MDKNRATRLAVDLTKHYLEACQITSGPTKERAEHLADFIEALEARLEKLDDGDQ